MKYRAGIGVIVFGVIAGTVNMIIGKIRRRWAARDSNPEPAD